MYYRLPYHFEIANIIKNVPGPERLTAAYRAKRWLNEEKYHFRTGTPIEQAQTADNLTFISGIIAGLEI